MRIWTASARNGYHAVDQERPGQGSGTYGDPLNFSSRSDAEKVAAALNDAYRAGMAESEDR